jgi:hypothetical protein
MSIGNRPAQDFPIREEVIVINNDPDPAKAQVVLRTYSPLSSAFQDLEVNMALAPGNPELAAQLTKRSQGIEDAKRAIFYSPIAGGTIGAARLLPSLVKGGLSRVKGAFVQPSKVPLQITPGSRGLPKSQQQSAGVMIDPTKLEATKFTRSLGQGAKVATPGILGYGALSGLQPTPLTGDDLKQAVEDAKITQSQGEEIKDQLNIVGDINKPSDVIATTETDVVDDTEDINKDTNTETDENASDKDNIKTLEDVGQERFIDPDALIAFVRNVGAGLSTTGQFGSGLTLGSKMAAEERAKRDILETQEKKEIQKEEALLEKKFELDKKLLKMKGTEPTLDAKEVAAQSTNLSDEISKFKSNEQARGLVEASIMVLQDAINSGEKLTGVGGFFKKLQDQVQALVSTQEGFDNLSARTKIDKLSEIVKLSNAREILNDTRLSNYERQILGDAFGELKTLEDPSIALGKFRKSLQTLKENNEIRQDLISTLHEGLLSGGLLGGSSYARTASDVSEIQKIDLDISTAVETLNRLIQGQEFGTNVIGLAD